MSFLGAQNSIALGVQGIIAIDTGVVGSADYLLAKSLRFRSSASAYLARTPATATNQKTWTWSGWVKRGTLGTTQNLATVANTGASLYFYLRFLSTDVLEVFTYNSAGSVFVWQLQTTQLFRDPAAWYHIVVATDTTQGTASNRVKIYVNGAQITAFAIATYPSASYDTVYNFNGASYVTSYLGAANFYDGELAELNSVDGQALAPTAFGASSIYNQWLPIKYAGTYGTNGFYLPFTNTASTSTLVADSSGNANNWTPNNISLTAGSTYDSLTDVPTLTSTTVANYAVLNPLNSGGTALPTPPTASNGNLSWAYNRSTSGQGWLPATIAIPTTGKWYFEFVETSDSVPSCAATIGLMDVTTSKSAAAPSIYRGYYLYNGQKGSNGTYTAYGTAVTFNDIVGVAVDMDNGALYFSKNGTWQNSGVPTSGASTTGAAFTDLVSAGVTWIPMLFADGGNSSAGYSNFGQQAWQGSIPTGFLPLNTFNI